MLAKFPTVKTFTTEAISKSRVAVYEDGVYICQLRPAEVSAWLFRARRDTVKHAADEASITVTRIKNAIEYMNARKSRESANLAAAQMSFF